MIEQKFGMLTILKDTGKRTIGRSIIYLCKCDCGKIKEVSIKLLKNEKKPRSCGCSRKIRSKLVFNSKYENKEGCWEWKGNFNRGGYGKIGTKKLAHRVAYEYAYGPITIGKQVCHKCDNRKCVNPSHLFLGTITENMADKVKKNRQAKGSKIGSSVLTEEIVLEIRKMRIGGKDYQEIADHFSIGWYVVRRICKDNTWKHVPLGEECSEIKQNRRAALGSSAGGAKLKEEDVREIRCLIAEGMRNKDIAIIYGVKQSTICDIKGRRTWNHIA